MSTTTSVHIHFKIWCITAIRSHRELCKFIKFKFPVQDCGFILLFSLSYDPIGPDFLKSFMWSHTVSWCTFFRQSTVYERQNGLTSFFKQNLLMITQAAVHCLDVLQWSRRCGPMVLCSLNSGLAGLHFPELDAFGPCTCYQILPVGKLCKNGLVVQFDWLL